MIRAKSAEDASWKGHNLAVLFIHILKIFVTQKVLWGFFCQCMALRKFCPLLLLHCSTNLWVNQLQMVPVPDISCLTYVHSHSKPTALAVVPEKLVNASKRKTFSATSVKWSKPARRLLTFLDCCAVQTSSALKPPLVFKIHSWGLCTLIVFMGPHITWMEVESLMWWILWEL